MAVGEKAVPLVAVPTEAAQVYVLAPEPFTVMELFKQIKVLLAEADTIGKAIILTVVAATLVLVQPAVLVPVTEYVVVVDGAKAVLLIAPPVQV